VGVITTSSNHTRVVDFNASLLESPFTVMKACCQLAETLVSFLLLQQLSEDFYYYFSCWLVLQHAFNIIFTFCRFEDLALALKSRVCPEFTILNIYFLLCRIFEQHSLALNNRVVLEFFTVLNKYFLSFRIFEQLALTLKTTFALKIFKPERSGRSPASYGNTKIEAIGRNCVSTLRYP